MALISLLDRTLTKIQWLSMFIEEHVKIIDDQIICPNGLVFDFDTSQMPFSQEELDFLQNIPLDKIQLLIPSDLSELNSNWPANLFNLKGKLESPVKSVIDKFLGIIPENLSKTTDIIVSMHLLIIAAKN
jgi:hypothetical protein